MIEGRVQIYVLAHDRPHLLPIMLHSLYAQTYPNWQALVLDQSETGCNLAPTCAVMVLDPRRITYQRVPYRHDWGYSIMEEEVRRYDEAEWVLFANDDDYYMPLFLERLTATGRDFAYCSWINKSYCWAIDTVPEVGWIDRGGYIIRRSVFLAVGGWPKPIDGETDGKLAALVTRTYGCGKVPEILFVKN